MNKKIYNDAVKNYSRRIYQYLVKSLNSSAAAEDLVQDCFLKLWQNRDDINPEKIKSWLFTTAHNLMINYVKKNNRIDYTTEYKREPMIHPNEAFDTKQLVEQCLELLTPDQKSVIMLRDYEGYSYQDIMEILKMTEPQVKSLLFRARLKIKETLKQMNEMPI